MPDGVGVAATELPTSHVERGEVQVRYDMV